MGCPVSGGGVLVVGVGEKGKVTTDMDCTSSGWLG